ncbi:MAG: hypothetical protein IJB78_06050 [Oscillospiraceae bacterium]|nr:hypothetical protein [Oscillospiraceae bacterium]
MEGFTVGLALLDFVPVAAFGAAGIIAGLAMNSPLFLVGAILSTLAGCLKAGWKLILGACKKDIKWMNKCFVPMQVFGFLSMMFGAVFALMRVGMAVMDVIFVFPQILFFALFFGLMGLMVYYRKHHFKHDDAKSNWTAEIINSLAQLSFLAAVLFCTGRI